MRDSEAFAGNARRSGEEADAAILQNVRERCLRAEAAWTEMATRSRKTEASRDAREARILDEIAPDVFATGASLRPHQ